MKIEISIQKSGFGTIPDYLHYLDYSFKKSDIKSFIKWVR